MKLLYAAPHVLHFKERVHHIEELLGAKGKAVWEEECTVVLNDLLRCVQAHIR